MGIVGATAMGLSQLAESYELLIVGRYLIGVNCGKSFILELIQSASSQVRREPNWAYSKERHDTVKGSRQYKMHIKQKSYLQLSSTISTFITIQSETPQFTQCQF